MQLLRLLASATILGTLGSLAIACSSGDSESSPGGACAQYAAAIKDYSARCGGSTYGFNEERMKVACASALATNGTSITPRNVSDCAQGLKGLACGDSLSSAPACDFPPGKLADGTACVGSDQCQSEYCKKSGGSCGVCTGRAAIGATCAVTSDCVKDARCSGSKCVAAAVNPVGGSCDALKGESCQSGAFCDSATKICKARLAAGGACTISTQCQTNLTCDTMSKTCVAPKVVGEGQTCGGTTKCQPDSACDPTTSKCAKVTIVAPGGDCGGRLQLCGEGQCNSTTKKCPTVIPDRGACVAGDPTQTCAEYASCVDGKCLLAGQVVCK